MAAAGGKHGEPDAATCHISALARKKKKRFSATKAVKALARERVGAPPATRSVPHSKKTKAPKHKPTLGKLLAGE